MPDTSIQFMQPTRPRVWNNRRSPVQAVVHFELVVIGGGSGGVASAKRAAELGATVGIIDSGKLGGAFARVNYRCDFADLSEKVNDASIQQIEWTSVVEKREAFNAKLNGLEGSKIRVINGEAHLIGRNKISLNGRIFTADHVILACGGQPVIPNIPGSELGITYDQLRTKPKRVTVVGSGHAAVKLVQTLQKMGSTVTMAIKGDHVLGKFDQMISEAFTAELESQGVDLRKRCKITSVIKDGAKLVASVDNGNDLPPVDAVVWAIGKRPNTASLRLGEMALNKHGRIVVDDESCTSTEGHYALGDIADKALPAPQAIAAGRRLAERLFGGMAHHKLEHDFAPNVLASNPPIGTIGLTEKEAVDKHGENGIRVYEAKFNALHPGILSEEAEEQASSMKLICTGTEEKVIGLHVIGNGVDKMLEGYRAAIGMGATKADFQKCIVMHPTSGEEQILLKDPRSGKA